MTCTEAWIDRGWHPTYAVILLGGLGARPVTLGAGERLFDGVPPLHLEIVAVRAASLVTHIGYRLPH